MNDKIEMCWRLYVDGELKGTYCGLSQAVFASGEWYANGYTAEQIDIKHETY